MDPVGFVEENPMSFNRYLYVNNNPYRYVDPDGKYGRVLAAISRPIRSPKVAARAVSREIRGFFESVGALEPTAKPAEYESDIPLGSIDKEKKGRTRSEYGKCPDCGKKTSNKPGKIGRSHGLSIPEVEDRIHGLKGDKLHENPDLEVCNGCGEAFPQGDEGLGDSLGNIKDEY
jgi:hypothetical protein